jgi:hypothetical protein
MSRLRVGQVRRLTYPKKRRTERFANVPQFVTWFSIRGQQFDHGELRGIGVLVRLQ